MVLQGIAFFKLFHKKIKDKIIGEKDNGIDKSNTENWLKKKIRSEIDRFLIIFFKSNEEKSEEQYLFFMEYVNVAKEYNIDISDFENMIPEIYEKCILDELKSAWNKFNSISTKVNYDELVRVLAKAEKAGIKYDRHKNYYRQIVHIIKRNLPEYFYRSLTYSIEYYFFRIKDIFEKDKIFHSQTFKLLKNAIKEAKDNKIDYIEEEIKIFVLMALRQEMDDILENKLDISSYDHKLFFEDISRLKSAGVDVSELERDFNNVFNK